MPATTQPPIALTTVASPTPARAAHAPSPPTFIVVLAELVLAAVLAASRDPEVPEWVPVDDACVVVVAEVDVVEATAPEKAAPLEIVERVEQEEDEGRGCAGGVFGSPWWNVEPPYTPIG